MSQLSNMIKLARSYVDSAKKAKELGFIDAYHAAMEMAEGVIKKLEFELDSETKRRLAILEQYIKPDEEEEEEA